MIQVTSEHVRGRTQLDVELNNLEVFWRSTFEQETSGCAKFLHWKRKKNQMRTNGSANFNNYLYRWLFFMPRALQWNILLEQHPLQHPSLFRKEKVGTIITILIGDILCPSSLVFDTIFHILQFLMHHSAIWCNTTDSMLMTLFLITFQWLKWVQSLSSCLIDFSPSSLWLCLNLLTFWL